MSAGSGYAEGVEARAQRLLWVGGVLQRYDSKIDSAWRREATHGLFRAKTHPRYQNNVRYRACFLKKYFAPKEIKDFQRDKPPPKKAIEFCFWQNNIDSSLQFLALTGNKH